MTTLHDEWLTIGDRAVAASRELLRLSPRRKKVCLEAMAAEIELRKADILAANRRDVEEAQNAGMSPALLDRLVLNESRVAAMVKGIRAVATLRDPVGMRISRWMRPNGLVIVKERVPIGVIAVIYESRPNVTADTASLCVKTANAVILRGGKEAMRSNQVIVDALTAGGRKKGLPEHAIQLVTSTDHDAVRILVQMEGRVDVVIPRGGEALIRAVMEHARVPVIKHYKGVCHTYVDETASIDMAMAICENAKCQRPGVCNAMEKMLVHEKIAPAFLPRMAARFRERGVELRGDAAARVLVPWMKEATEQDWHEEYLDLILAVKIVPSLEAAIAHINRYGSRHSDAIVTNSEEAARIFTRDVDSAAVYVNASTRFTDGGEFGMGAEIGISTDKLHARGPMGLEELTTYKYSIRGTGQIRL